MWGHCFLDKWVVWDGLPGQMGWLCRWMLLLHVNTWRCWEAALQDWHVPVLTVPTPRQIILSDASLCIVKATLPSFFLFPLSLFFSLFLFYFFFPLLSSHLPTTPNPNWDLMLRARWSSECIQPDDFHMSRALCRWKMWTHCRNLPRTKLWRKDQPY